MTLKELHNDMERYLQKDCYCPHEIYSSDGFFYQLFFEDDECEKLGVVEDVIYCVVEKTDNHSRQILEVRIENDKILDITRYDATDNNIEIVAHAIKHNSIEETIKWMKENNRRMNEFVKGSTAKSLKQILELSNGIIMCD